MNDLAEHIQSLRLIDTHEHLNKEHDILQHGPDILQDLFENYIAADLVVAGATEAAPCEYSRGRSSARMTSFGAMIRSRSTALRSSRMLPRQR